jgi:ribonuclease-3
MSLEENIGYNFKNKDLLNRALTRKAYANELKHKNQESEDQEIFRTLGDAVLKAVLIDLLIESGCNSRDDITSRKKKLEREEGLAEISKQLGIGHYIKLGIGEKKQKADKEPYVLAETFEALIAAIYLDGGFDVTRNIIKHLFKDHLNSQNET